MTIKEVTNFSTDERIKLIKMLNKKGKHKKK